MLRKPRRGGYVTRNIREKLREAYRRTWLRDWPYEDEYLGKLWLEAGEVWPSTGTHTAKRHALCLELMRECHQFEPVP